MQKTRYQLSCLPWPAWSLFKNIFMASVMVYTFKTSTQKGEQTLWVQGQPWLQSPCLKKKRNKRNEREKSNVYGFEFGSVRKWYVAWTEPGNTRDLASNLLECSSWHHVIHLPTCHRQCFHSGCFETCSNWTAVFCLWHTFNKSWSSKIQCRHSQPVLPKGMP